MKLARLLKGWSLIASLRNRLLNALASIACGQRVSVDWRNLKIHHPSAISVGRNFSAGHSLWLESVEGRGRLDIGDDVNLSDSVHIGCALFVQIGDGVLIGSKVLVTDHSHGSTRDVLGDVVPQQRAIVVKGPVNIGKAVWIGDGACILSGVTIGERAIIGANSVVTSDVPSRTVWAGAPARQVWPHHDGVAHSIEDKRST